MGESGIVSRELKSPVQLRVKSLAESKAREFIKKKAKS
jgi:hypothetical protein